MASNESPTTAQRLQARLQALTERFATLASVLREDAIPLLELGVAPDQAITEEFVAACIEYGGGPHALGAQTASIRCDNKLASRETSHGSRADAVAA
jgi:hypothetical protein